MTSEAHELRHGIILDGPSAVGWDEACPINETLDGSGNPPPPELQGFGQADPSSVGMTRSRADPKVQALREYLKENNGIKGLEICEPHELDRIEKIFQRDGFCVVRDLLDAKQLEIFREGCSRRLAELLSVPGPNGQKYMCESTRLPHRYSYGTCSASRQLLHDMAWASQIDLPTTTPILKRLFGSEDYVCHGAGGDLCLPGAVEYQHLHRDGHPFGEMSGMSAGRLDTAKSMGLGVEDGKELDLRTMRDISEKVTPSIGINFCMSDLTWENGPIRQIPGTHTNVQPPPRGEEEPPWMKLSTCVGAPAGAGVFRDHRAWHGATPNLSEEVRVLPGIEYGPAWSAGPGGPRTMPFDIWEQLSPHAQHVTRFVVAEPGVHPPGAGMLHPLADDRFDFFIAEGGGGNRDAAQLEKAKIAYSRGATGSIYSVLGPERKPKL